MKLAENEILFLLKKHSNKITSTDILLYTGISVSLCQHQKIFISSFRSTWESKETHNWQTSREKLSPSSIPPLRAQGILQKWRQKNCEVLGIQDRKETVPLRLYRTDTYMTSQRLRQHTQGLQKYSPDGVQVKR